MGQLSIFWANLTTFSMEALDAAMAEDGTALPAAADLVHTCFDPPDGQGRGVGGWSFDCEATLTDSQVLEFCRAGFLIIPAAVPPECRRSTSGPSATSRGAGLPHRSQCRR